MAGNLVVAAVLADAAFDAVRMRSDSDAAISRDNRADGPNRGATSRLESPRRSLTFASPCRVTSASAGTAVEGTIRRPCGKDDYPPHHCRQIIRCDRPMYDALRKDGVPHAPDIIWKAGIVSRSPAMGDVKERSSERHRDAKDALPSNCSATELRRDQAMSRHE